MEKMGRGTQMKDLTADLFFDKWEWIQQICTVVLVSNATLLTYLGPILRFENIRIRKNHTINITFSGNLLANLKKGVFSPSLPIYV